jgi:hypothetical protein
VEYSEPLVVFRVMMDTIFLEKASRVMGETEGVAIECRGVRPLLDALLSGELAVDTGMLAYAHLAACDDCARLFDDMSRIRAKLKRAVRADAPADSLRESILRRIRGE